MLKEFLQCMNKYFQLSSCLMNYDHWKRTLLSNVCFHGTIPPHPASPFRGISVFYSGFFLLLGNKTSQCFLFRTKFPIVQSLFQYSFLLHCWHVQYRCKQWLVWFVAFVLKDRHLKLQAVILPWLSFFSVWRPSELNPHRRVLKVNAGLSDCNSTCSLRA